MKSTVKSILQSLILTVLCAMAVVEIGIRRFIVPRDFLYIDVEPSRSPFFSLVDSYDVFPVSIRDGRHEEAPRGERRKKVAFVGDSVTFCANVRIEDCFVERLHNQQKIFDAYNYGVPGYGIVQVSQQLDTILQAAHPDLVVYTFNFNDVHSAAPVLLTLMEKSEDRLVALENYQGARGTLKSWLRRFYQTPLVLNYFYSMLTAVPPSPPQVVSASGGVASVPTTPDAVTGKKSGQDCYASIQRESEGYLYRSLYPLWRHIYADKEVLLKLQQKFQEIRAKVEAGGARLLVAASYDFLIFENQDLLLPRAFSETADRAAVKTVDLYPLFQDSFKECGTYSDPGHPGPLGFRNMARHLLPAILNELDAGSPSAQSPPQS